MVLRVGVKEQCFGTILFAANAMVAVHNMGAVHNRIRRYANKAEGRYAQSEKNVDHRSAILSAASAGVLGFLLIFQMRSWAPDLRR